jgi:hypothetical protein
MYSISSVIGGLDPVYCAPLGSTICLDRSAMLRWFLESATYKAANATVMNLIYLVRLIGVSMAVLLLMLV